MGGTATPEANRAPPIAAAPLQSLFFKVGERSEAKVKGGGWGQTVVEARADSLLGMASGWYSLAARFMAASRCPCIAAHLAR